MYIPKRMPLSIEADIEEPAQRFQLTGASIECAIRQAANLALLRAGKNAVISHEDLTQAAGMALTKQARMMAVL